jgi:hypothetical protein
MQLGVLPKALIWRELSRRAPNHTESERFWHGLCFNASRSCSTQFGAGLATSIKNVYRPIMTSRES